jgi:hypothetical protein
MPPYAVNQLFKKTLLTEMEYGVEFQSYDWKQRHVIKIVMLKTSWDFDLGLDLCLFPVVE